MTALKEPDKINFSNIFYNIFYLTQYIQNIIISSCKQHKICSLEMLFVCVCIGTEQERRKGAQDHTQVSLRNHRNGVARN